MTHSIRTLIAITLTVSLSNCSTTKFVGDKKLLLDKVYLHVDDQPYKNVVKKDDLRPYVKQLPNFKVFGFLKWPLYVYGWAGQDSTKWINRQLHLIGEPPEIVDKTLIKQSVAELQQFMVNKGFLHAQVEATIDTARTKRKATVNYWITPNQPCFVAEYTINVEDPNLNKIIQQKKQHRSWIAQLLKPAADPFEPLIQPRTLFDRDLLDLERQRVTSLLQDSGYYKFHTEHVRFHADTTVGATYAVVQMSILPNFTLQQDGTEIALPHKKYYLNQIDYIVDHDPLKPQLSPLYYPMDSVSPRPKFNIYYGYLGRTLRPSVIRQHNFLAPNRQYSERQIEQTYASMMSLRALRHINFRYEEFEENDSLKLNCTVLLTPEEKQGVGVEVEGTNSAGDLGFASSVNYQHRNLFKGSELFSAKIRGAYESIAAGTGDGQGSYWEYAGEASLNFPNFLFPFVGRTARKRLRATTELKFSYDQQNRPEYRRAILSAGWSYLWKSNRNNQTGRHVFKLIDVDYIYLPYIDNSFRDSLPDITALYNYNDLFVVGSGYTYSITNYDPLKKTKNTYSLLLSIKSAGNLLYGLSNILNTPKDEHGRYQLMGINFSQFVKGDIDFARSITVDTRNSFAFHLGLGLGIPYGNAKELPFEQRYFAGGANNNRGWSIRSLGPGSMPVTDRTTFVNQVGDVRMEANIEYRTKLFWKFELAAYVDAGNVWTAQKYDYQPNGDFSFDRFYKEIAVSYGLGLRMDFDYFLVRFDTGMKARNPQQTGNRKWAILYPLDKNQFAWHFAVGYPF